MAVREPFCDPLRGEGDTRESDRRVWGWELPWLRNPRLRKEPVSLRIVPGA